MYLFSGATGSLLARIDSPGEIGGGFFGLEDPDRNAPGDVNADGTRDLYFSAFNAGSLPAVGGHSGAGRAWTFDGAQTLATGTGVVLYEITDPLVGERRAFGWANSETDYNKDGRPDLFVSNLATRNTTVSVFDGRNGAELKRFSTPAADVAADAQGALGWSSRAPGDLNGDCEPDYVAGAPYQDVAGRTDQGRVYFFLSDGPGACPVAPPPPPPPVAVPPPPPVAVPPPPPPAVPAIVRKKGKLSSKATPRTDLKAPYTFRVTGKLTRPSSVSKARACTGRVSVQWKRGQTTISTRRVSLTKNCTYSVKVTFRDKSRFASFKRLKFTARFLGNRYVLRVSATSKFVRVRR